jgi:hypothetical protein
MQLYDDSILITSRFIVSRIQLILRSNISWWF